MLLDGVEMERLADEVAGMAGESRTEAVRRALEERRERLTAGVTAAPTTARDDRLTPEEAAVRLAAWRELQDRLQLTPEAADAWVAEVRAERDAHRLPSERE